MIYPHKSVCAADLSVDYSESSSSAKHGLAARPRNHAKSTENVRGGLTEGTPERSRSRPEPRFVFSSLRMERSFDTGFPGDQASRINNSRFRPAQATQYKRHTLRNGSACTPKNLIFKPGFLTGCRVGAHDAVDRKAIDSPRAMTLQSHATPEVLAKPGFASPAPDEFDPFAPWAATLDGAVKKRNLSTGEPRSWIRSPSLRLGVSPPGLCMLPTTCLGRPTRVSSRRA